MSRNLPPDAARARRRLWLQIARFYGGGALAAGLSIAVGGWLLLVGGEEATGLGRFVGGAFVLAGALWASLFRPGADLPPEEEGLLLDPAAEPRLAATVERIAGALGVRHPVEIVLTPGTGLSCQEVGAHFGRRRRCRVEVGLAQMQALDAPRLEALLALHLAHQADGDLLLRRTLARTLRAIERTTSTSAGWVGRRIGARRKRLLAAWRAYQAVHVHAVDRAAAGVAGGMLYRAALQRSAILPGIWEQFLADEVQPLLDEGFVPADLYGGFRLCLETLGETRQLRRIEEQAATEEAEGGHPSLGERLEHLRELPPTLESLDAAQEGDASRGLLLRPGEAEGAAAALLLPDAAEKEAIAWEAVAERVWAVRFKAKAAALRGALPPGTSLAFVIDWLAAAPTQVALAAAAWPGLLEVADPEERQREARRQVHRGLAGWIGEELEQRGWRWDTSPGYAVELVDDDGRRVSPSALIARLGTEAGAVEALHEQLAELGLGQRPAPARQRTRSYLH